MIYRIAFAAVFVVGLVAAPPALAQTVPSHAVGRTHDCSTQYPELARRYYEEGDVLVSYDVGANGVIGRVVVKKTSGFPRLDQAAVACVHLSWKNTPAMANGKAVPSPNHLALIRYVLPEPVAAEDFLVRGLAYEHKGQHDRALADFNKAVALKPTLAVAYSARAITLDALGQHDKAKADRDKAKSLLPKTPTPPKTPTKGKKKPA